MIDENSGTEDSTPSEVEKEEKEGAVVEQGEEEVLSQPGMS